MLRRLAPWLPFILFALAVTARLLPGARIIDDAYITFRYARNLLGGLGFVYTAGQPVLGTTTPLFTLLLAVLALPFGGATADFPQLAIAVSALADGATAVLLLALGRRLGNQPAGLAAGLAWAVAPFSVAFAVGGLETSFYVLLLVGTMWAYLHGRVALAAGLAAAAILTRPDALLLVAPLLAWHALHARPSLLNASFWRTNAKAILVFLLPLLAWTAFAWLHFGSPLAQSVAAKSNAYRIGALDMLAHLVNHYATPFMEHLSFGMYWLYIGLWLYPFLFVLGALWVWKREHSALAFLLFPWLYFFVFALANPHIFRWYLTPPLPFYFLFIALGVHKLITDIGKQIQFRNSELSRILAAILIVLPAISLLRGWTLRPQQPPMRPAPQMAWVELELLYKEAANFLQHRLAAVRTPPTVAASDVGVLGYYLDVRILDMVGLNSKETLPYYPLDAQYYGDFLYAIPPDLVMDYRPDYVVILEIYGRYGLLQDARFLSAYELLHTIPTNIYGSDGLTIYARK